MLCCQLKAWCTSCSMFPATSGVHLFNKGFNMKIAEDDKNDDKEFILRFIEDYRNLPQLWDQNNFLYTNKIKRNEGLQILSFKYKMDIDGVKKKIKSLRSYYSRELHKVKRKRNNLGADEMYESPWFAYKPLSFIADSVALRENTAEELKDWEETEIFGENTATSQSTFISEDGHDITVLTKKRKRNVIANKIDNKEEVIYSFMKKAADELAQSDDEWTIYGKLIVHKIRNLSSRNRLIAQQRINSILFDLEMEQNASDVKNESEKPP